MCFGIDCAFYDVLNVLIFKQEEFKKRGALKWQKQSA